MDGYERLNTAEKQVNSGDVKGLRETLDTMQTNESRQTFMRMMKDRCVYNSTSPDCEIVKSDESISQISYKGRHPLKITAAETGRLKAQLTNPTVLDVYEEQIYEEKRKLPETQQKAPGSADTCTQADGCAANLDFKARYRKAAGENL